MANTPHDSETPAHGLQVITACAFIHHNFDGVEKVFLPKRAATKKFLPNVFEMPGGHIDFGEDILSGLKREVLEEMGKEITVGDPFVAFTYTNHIKGSHSVEVVYFAEFKGGIDGIQLDPEYHSDYGWFSEEDVIARRPEIVPSEHVTYEHEDDPEYLAILKGFKLLRGEKVSFA